MYIWSDFLTETPFDRATSYKNLIGFTALPYSSNLLKEYSCLNVNENELIVLP